LARVLAREGMMEQVAAEYTAVRKQYVPARTAWQRLSSILAIR